ncbi:MAG: nucleoside deaminase [Verrucomicrobia bacterium]|nr:nucleoside deaminase [Verrucomicrobiota bacterium]
MPPDHKPFMDRALALAREAMEAGDGPAGCVCVFQGKIVAEGRNRVQSALDPTAHAELLALRAAATRLGRTDLSGLTLYTTMEPCPMCCWALLSAKVSMLVLGARYAQFRTLELGAYSVEGLAAMTGRTLELITGIRDAECRDLRYEALQRSVREGTSETRRSIRAAAGNPWWSLFRR